MIREYLFSEVMHYLNISTSRSLALFNTGDSVYRESRQQGSVLVRVMKSHIRIVHLSMHLILVLLKI